MRTIKQINEEMTKILNEIADNKKHAVILADDLVNFKKGACDIKDVKSAMLTDNELIKLANLEKTVVDNNEIISSLEEAKKLFADSKKTHEFYTNNGALFSDRVELKRTTNEGYPLYIFIDQTANEVMIEISANMHDEYIAKETLISEVEKLKGKLFSGTLVGDRVDVDASGLPEILFADYMANFENIARDNLSLDDVTEYTHFLQKLDYLRGDGYNFKDNVHDDFTDEEIIDAYNDGEAKSWCFFNLTIYPDKFDGDFTKLAKEIDAYVAKIKTKYDELKKK